MLKKKTCVMALTSLLLLNAVYAQNLAAQSPTKPRRSGDVIYVKPHDLALHIRGKKVTAMRIDGSWLEGKVKDITADQIRIDIKKSSSDLIKKGKHDIPITEFSSFSLKKTKGALGRIVATPSLGLLGAAVGFRIGSSASGSDNGGWLGYLPFTETYVGTSLGLGLGLTGGYLIGRAIDSKKVVIMIVK